MGNCLEHLRIRITGFQITEGSLYFRRHILSVVGYAIEIKPRTTTIFNGCVMSYSYFCLYLKKSSSKLPLITQLILL
jgi:hypothetical protein